MYAIGFVSGFVAAALLVVFLVWLANKDIDLDGDD